jgi:hypothetical protein
MYVSHRKHVRHPWAQIQIHNPRKHLTNTIQMQLSNFSNLQLYAALNELSFKLKSMKKEESINFLLIGFVIRTEQCSDWS